MALARWWWCVAAAAAWWCVVSATAPPPADPLQAKCAADVQKLMDCLDYATGHAASPTSTCCADTADTQKARPECLCYIIEQANGGGRVQTLGLRLDRLMALPTACKLATANVTLCINLLNLKPGSPDYALFANASKLTPSTDGGPASDTAASAGFRAQAGVSGGVALAIISAALSSVF